MLRSSSSYPALLRTYLSPLRGRVLLLTLFLFGGIALQLVSPQILRHFLDSALARRGSDVLLGAALLFLVVALLQQGLTIATTYLGEDVGWAATNRLRGDLVRHVLRLDLPFHHRHTPGELIERLDGDVSSLAALFSELVIRVLGNLLLAAGILILLFREEWRVGLIGVGYSLLLLVLLRRLQSFTVARWERAREASATFAGFIEERLGGTEDIRAQGAVGHVMAGLERQMARRAATKGAADLVGSLTFVVGYTLYILATIATLALSTVLFLRGEMTLGTVYLVAAYMGALEAPLNAIRREIDELHQAAAGIGRIRELLGVQPAVEERAVPTALPAGALALRFDQVTFAYGEQGPALEEITFDLPPGRVLGLLGHTGSGKSTLTRLLFRLYEPSEGRIELGGVPLNAAALGDLRRRVGLVTQEVQLFEGTIRDNLTFFDPRIDDARLLDALEALGLRAWLERQPEGLDTMLAPGGGRLSAGEAQLLAFARILLREPGLLVLDEASSRLDPATERLMERAIDRLLHGRTALIIAHRLATVQRADDILILENGRVLEYGSRVALSADPDSHFARLLRTGMEVALS